VETEMPLPAVAADNGDALDFLASDLVLSADQVASALRSAVRGALFSAEAPVKLDTALLTAVRERLWEATEAPFFAMLERAAGHAECDMSPLRAEWLRRLRGTALMLFDESAPLSPETGLAVAQRVSRARRFLGFTLYGYNKAGTELFGTLALPAPQANEMKKRRKAA
jgi:CRISPR system Cascade subunit CasA